MSKVGFVSLGCPKNLVDSEVMMGLLARAGCELTPKAEEAEVLVVNTCSFIEPAQKESVDTILEMAEYKRSGTARRLIVTGCLVERYRDQLRAEIPEIDGILGTNDLEKILEAVQDGAPGSFSATAPYLYHEATPRVLATPGHYAYIKIAEGCDHPCSFCIIPQLRGQFRSRRFESVVREAEQLTAAGARELVLIGQDTTSYGEDLQIDDGLPLLLQRLAGLENASWVRFLYCYPNRITQRLLDTIALEEKLVPYIDCPLQHASADMLKRMKRGSNGDAFLQLLERIRQTIPSVALRTSFIVGFPGETEKDFETLCEFVRAAEFDHLGVFLYSDEDTSGSFALDSKVSPEEAERRRQQLMEIQQPIAAEKNEQKVGRRFPALLEGASRDTDLLWEARLASQAPEIDGKLYINDCALETMPRAGTFVTVEITEARGYDLIGKVLDAEEPRPVTQISARQEEPALVQIHPGR
jgi:ribosomal protein S12 methylthiotransferase